MPFSIRHIIFVLRRKDVWLIVGLGNPGEEYAKTRHNIGFQCVNELARRHGLDFDEKRAKSRIAEGRSPGSGWRWRSRSPI